jgi:hypothetical protein
MVFSTSAEHHNQLIQPNTAEDGHILPRCPKHVELFIIINKLLHQVGRFVISLFRLHWDELKPDYRYKFPYFMININIIPLCKLTFPK